MKKIIQLLVICITIFKIQLSYAQTPTVPAGYSIRQVAQGGLLAGQILDGIVADPASGNLYVAGVSNPYSSGFNLYKITPAGVVSFIGTYNFAHTEIVKMAFNVADGHIYTLDNNSGSVYKIDPASGAASVYSSGIGSGRYGLEFDASGNLIIAFESIFDFYRVTPAGKTSLGHVSASVPNGNHGDAFGIQPNGDYVVYVDCGGQNNYSISAAGHVDGTNYTTLAWTSPTNIFTSLMPGGCGYSNGAIDPNTGDVYSSIANFGNGNTRILFTAENGGPTTLFVDGAAGIMDMSFGKESTNGNCNSLYFVDRNLNAVFEVPMNNCCFPSPSATTVTGGGTFCASTTITAAGGDGGVIYFQGTTNGGTSTATPSASEVITSSGTYYFRAQIPGGCWGKQGSVSVNIKPAPETPVISPEGNIEYCEGNPTTTTLTIPATNFSAPITYNINAGGLVGMSNDCGNGSRYGNNGGISWTDNGLGIITNVEVKFNVGVECGGSAHTTTFNALAAPGFNTSSWCSCSPPSASQIKTINFNPTNYNVGGVNTLLFSGNTFGLYPDASLGGYYAQVTVTYGSPPVLWSPGGETTNSITVSPATTSTYTVAVTGGNGCSSQSEKTITVKVCNQPPVAVCGALSISTNADCLAFADAVDFDGGSSDPDGDALTYSVSPVGPYAIGVTNVVLTVTDTKGASNSCNATVTVSDNTSPVAVCKNITVQLDATGNASIVAADINNGSTDACGIASLAIDKSTFDCSNVGANTVTLTVTDVNGNVSECTSTVTVEDHVAPIAKCKNITVQLDANGQAVLVGSNAVFYDFSCDRTTFGFSNVSQSFTATTSGFITKIGAGIGLWGSSVSYGTIITSNSNSVNYGTLAYSGRCCYSQCVSGNNMAFVTLPSAFYVNAGETVTISFSGSSGEKHYSDGQLRMYVTGVTTGASLIDDGSTDACGIANWTIDKSTFDCSNVGANTVTLTVTDVNGNGSTCTSTVTVEDNVVPTAICKSITVQLDATGNASIIAADINDGSTDACGIASLAIDKSTFDCSNVGANTVTLTVTDVNGNVSTCTSTVTVEDNVAPVAVCQNITVQLDASGGVSIAAGDINNGSTDACGIESLAISKSTFDCSDVGVNEVILIVTDVNGNVSECASTVTVEDHIAPVALCKNIIVQLDATGTASIIAADVNGGSTDACGIASLAIDKSIFDCSNIGTNTVILTVTDVNGNASTCASTVTVEDHIAPIMGSCPESIFIQAQRNDCSPVVNWAAPTASDNCTYTVISNYQPGDRFSIGTTTVTYSVVDSSGNTASCSFNVTVTPDPLVSSVSAKTYIGGHHVSCKGKNNGEATVVADGGCLPYVYLWSNGQTNATATGLLAGTYTVNVSDANGTITSSVITLTEPAQLVADAGINQTVYYGYNPSACATLTGTATGGITAYTYAWSNGALTPATSVCPNVTTSYNLTVTDVNGCVANDMVTVCAIDVRCDKGGKAIVYYEGGKVLVCHIPGGDITKRETICISPDAVADHLAHGDQLGICDVNAACNVEDVRAMADESPEEITIGNEMNVLVFPNPFSATATISFNSTQDERITVKVYNIKGVLVADLFEEDVTAGEIRRDIIFNGNDLPSGMYFAKVTTSGGKVIVRKVLLNK